MRLGNVCDVLLRRYFDLQNAWYVDDFIAHKHGRGGCIQKQADIEDWLWGDALNKECNNMSTSKLRNKNFTLSLFGVLCHVVQLEDKFSF